MELHEPTPKTDSERIVELYKVTQYLLTEIRGLRLDINRIPARCNAQNERLNDLEQWRSSFNGRGNGTDAPARLHALEVWRGRITGGLVIVGIVTTALLAWIGKLFGLP